MTRLVREARLNTASRSAKRLSTDCQLHFRTWPRALLMEETCQFNARGGRHEERGMTKSKIVRVRWGLLRPGATVVSENEADHEHKVVTDRKSVV